MVMIREMALIDFRLVEVDYGCYFTTQSIASSEIPKFYITLFKLDSITSHWSWSESEVCGSVIDL